MEKSISQNQSSGFRKIYEHVKTFIDRLFEIEELEEGIELEGEITYIRDYEILWPICVLMV